MQAPRKSLLVVLLALGCTGPGSSQLPPGDASAPPPDSCANVTCGGHGQCTVADGTARCVCDDGYHAAGTDCVAASQDAGSPPGCTPNPCAGATPDCVLQGETPTCRCNASSCPADQSCVGDACVANGGSCSPANYTRIVNGQPFPSDFCAYAELPFRNLLPASPQNIDPANTTILREDYLPNSVSGMVDGVGMIATTGQFPPPSNGGSSRYPVYLASDSDPLVSIDCNAAFYGCSSGMSGVASLTDIHIPALARPTYPEGDNNMAVIQPDGTTYDLYWTGCLAASDFVTGAVLGGSGDPCGGGFFVGAHADDIVTGAGTNPGNVNGGGDFSALPVHYNEVVNGQINHALLVWSGCFGNATVYPGTGALRCSDGTGLPAGVHMWLSLTHAEIDAQPTSVIPEHMRVFAYAAHDYGIFSLDTLGGGKFIGQPMLEEGLPHLIFSGATPWTAWFLAHGGDLSPDGNLKLSDTIDWRSLSSYMYVLSPCYAQGTCAD